jgi:uncharacterized RDD family membrane protein YckC
MTTLNPEINLLSNRHASFGRRFLAVVLDGMILLIPAAVLGSILPFVGGLLAWFLYAPFFESSVLKATIGKKLMGIQVVDAAGARITFRAAMIRSLVKLLSCALSFLPYLTALFTEKKQAVHDMLAETEVVYGRTEVAAIDAWTENFGEVFRGAQAQLTPRNSGDNLSALERLQSLYERGALTKEEFDREKQKLLNS